MGEKQTLKICKMGSNYVNMGSGSGIRNTTSKIPEIDGLNDPNLSAEERDRRLALALQQQENAAVYENMKKKHDTEKESQRLRTTRSNAPTSLAAIRKKERENPKDFNNNSYSNYVAPTSGEKTAVDEFTRVDEACAGTAQLMNHIVKTTAKDKASRNLRNARSGQGAFKR